MSRPRDMDFIRAAKARRSLNRRACQAGLSGAGLRVWLTISDYTLGYCRVEDSLTHGRIAEETGLTRRSVSRALAEVSAAGLIRYQAGNGDPQQGRNAFSRIAVVMPTSEPQGGDDEMVPSRGDEMVVSPRGETTVLSGGRGRSGQEGDDELVPSRDDEMVPSEGTRSSTNRERATREDIYRESGTRDDSRGVVAPETYVQTARDEESATPFTVLADEDAEEGDVEPVAAVTRRVGVATAAQAVERFEAETGLPLSQRTRDALTTSLDEVARRVSPTELLLGLGYWHEYRSGKYPQDAAERVGEALAMESLPIDPCNAMGPAGAIQEGRCRAQVAALTRTEREALAADPLGRASGYGLDWPCPEDVRGLLPESSSQGSSELDAAIRDRLAQPGAWGRITASMARLDEALQAGAL